LDGFDLTAPGFLKARNVLIDGVALLPTQIHNSINPLIHSNVDRLNDAAFNRWLFWCNTARQVVQAAVVIGRYPLGSLLDGAGPYAVLAGAVFIEDQLLGSQFDPAIAFARLTYGRASAIQVAHPCLLACHTGSRTWGHWLLDMLPKIVLAEAAYPDKFTFVIPAPKSQHSAPDHFDTAVVDSLAAYGIGPNRLLHVLPDKIYQFRALHDIADIVCDGMHPGVLDVMRERVKVPRASGNRLTSILRGDVGRRTIVNLAAIDDVLRQHRAATLDPSRALFAAQVNAFRGSEIIVGDLGSNIAASIYMQRDASIVTLAPSGWYDGYFVNIFQRLGLRHADIRGLSFGMHSEGRGEAPYSINPRDLTKALSDLANLTSAGAPRVAGRIIARAPGEVLWKITFGQGGNAGPYQRGEFAAPEKNHTWSLGPSCGISVASFASPQGDCWLEIKGIGFTAPPHLMSRQLNIAVNGTRLAEYDIDTLTHLYVPLPASVLRDRQGLDIIFTHPVCPSPQMMGVSPDTRSLGFMFEYLAIRRA
jgi:hypothetical protein